jgi:hypothetical protein
VFLGSSVAYCDIIPDLLSGRAYVLAGPEQPMIMTYYYMREVYRSQHPDSIYIEISGLFFKNDNRIVSQNIGYIPYRPDMIIATFATTSRENWADLLFPLGQYHSRWDELTETDFEIALNGYACDPNSGHTLVYDISPQNEFLYEQGVDDYYDSNLIALEKMLELAHDRGSEVFLFYAPQTNRVKHELMDRFLLDLTILRIQPVFIDYNTPEYFEKIGLDLQTDFIDFMHLNHFGAEKFTRFLAL